MPKPPTKAQALAAALTARIIEGDLPPGAWLSPERQLAEEHDVDRSTVRRALQLLAEQKRVTLHPGVGAQVRTDEPVHRDAGDITRQVGSWRGFHVSAQRSGHEPYTEVTACLTQADVTLARWLGIPLGTEVLERARIQGLVGLYPVQTATTWVLMDIVEQIPVLREENTGPGGIYSRLAETGYEIQFEESVNCRLPRQDEQDTLAIDSDEPVLTTWRRAYDQNERIIEVTHRVVVGSRHELIYRYGASS
ncbi:GntR family transcriptional regulator [Actinomadura barringtoniae]|uniref:GntR family transcriptional regulator n=1 Tax=Actinomadura barringtoniae TaxID=1427535 RepID=A0A939PDN1_9ACTN|nr:GntR family transcriptional regulator [Actinomadura barringtoniae]MBO2450695.1 GntR family transcriptional regulator [Actinomadura barringtoniae]